LQAVNRLDHRKEAASAAKVVMSLCKTSNPTALEIVNDAADELTLDVKALSEQSESEFSLILSGGLLQNDTPLRQKFLKKIAEIKKINRIVALSCDPVYASAAIALENNGLSDAAEKLMSSVQVVKEL
jgi:N-acetylglucosamine kinase-like BadF-type ATPase